MHIRQTFLLETLRAVQGFLDDRSAVVAPVNESAARQTLDLYTQQLVAQAIDQSAGQATGKGETSLQTSLRRTLRLFHMKPIAAVAHARLRDVPEMSAFALPTAKTSSLRLVAAAGGMADAAAKHVDAFIAGGLAPDFIAQLTAATDALNRSIDSRAKNTNRKLGATTALLSLEKPSRDLLRVLDALVVPKLAHDERLLGEWRAAKRIRRKPGPVSGASATSAPSAPTEPAPEKTA